MTAIRVRAAGPDDEAGVAAVHRHAWGGPIVVGHDERFDLRELPTLVAVGDEGSVVGALAYLIDGDALEVVSIAAISPGSGVGTALLAEAERLARAASVRRLWLVTTNDNLDALRFYQRRGLRIAAVDPGAVDRARALKPSIPAVGAYGIPLRDELTLELRLADDPPLASGRPGRLR